MIFSKQFLKDTMLLSLISIVARILGLIRDVLLVIFLGTGDTSDAFAVAIKIPTIFRRTLSEGTLNNALLPYLKTLDTNDKNRINRFVTHTVILFCLIIAIFIVVETHFRDLILNILAPGFNDKQGNLSKYLLPISTLSIFTYFMYSIFAAMLEYQKCFIWTPCAIAILNTSMILSLIYLIYYKINMLYIIYFYLGSTILMMLSTCLPWIFQTTFEMNQRQKRIFVISMLTIITLFCLSIQPIRIALIISITASLVYYINNSPIIYLKDLQEFFTLLGPIFMSSVLLQTNETIFLSFASFFESGSVTILSRTSKIFQIPIAFVLPLFTTTFSYLNQNNNNQERIDFKHKSLLILCLFSIFFTLFLIIFAPFFLKLVFFNRITEQDLTNMTPLLRLYALALPAILMNKILQMFFFVDKQAFFTLRISAFQTLAYFASLSITSRISSSILYLPLPLIFCTWANTLLLLYFLKKRRLI